MNNALYQHVNSYLKHQQDDVLAKFVEALASQFDKSLVAVIFYGSCMHTREYSDSMLDFYVVVDNYHSAYSSRWYAVANKVLPPNVFYLQVNLEGQAYRAKFAVMSKSGLLAGVSKTSFHSYFWARFTQPLSFIYVRDQDVKSWITDIQYLAVNTFTSTVIPMLSDEFTSQELWVKGLQLTYSAELRTETKQRAVTIYQSNCEYYDGISKTLLPGENESYRSTGKLNFSSLRWKIRIVVGKILSVLRLMKATTTFANGVDYIAWKIQRHTGEEIEISDKLRKYPWIYCWPVLLRLYKEGKFR